MARQNPLTNTAPDEVEDAENPFWTEADFARAKPAKDIPELADVIRRGRPAMDEADRKQRVTMYLDRDLVDSLKAEGRGWQTRANALLRKAAGL